MLVFTALFSDGTRAIVRAVPREYAEDFRVMGITKEGTDIRLTCQAVGGTTNQVEVSPGLARTNTFRNLGPPIGIPGSGLLRTNFLDPGGATNAPARFYRVRKTP